jgi:D-arabinose 1-dehydrogenase-like Zn-dependent alcohol dehydrogenase
VGFVATRQAAEDPGMSPQCGNRGQTSVALAGSKREFEEAGVLTFLRTAAGKHRCDLEIVPIRKINRAFERLLGHNAMNRFVIDMQEIKSAFKGVGL